MKPPKRVMPELEWPWCNACKKHVREVSGVKHECPSPTATSSPTTCQTSRAWEQVPLFGGGL